RERLGGKFIASGVAGDGKGYLTNEDGLTFVVRAGPKFEVLARNALEEYTLASPAVSGKELFLRTEKHPYCISANRQGAKAEKKNDDRPPPPRQSGGLLPAALASWRSVPRGESPAAGRCYCR